MRNSLTQLGGASITLHWPEKNPDIFGKAISIRPGKQTKIALTSVATERLPPPYRSACVHRWPDDFEFYWQPYALHNCLSQVDQYYVYSKCECFRMQGLNGIVEFNPLYFNFCNESHVKCLKEADKIILKGEHSTNQLKLPDCGEPCSSIDYEV